VAEIAASGIAGALAGLLLLVAFDRYNQATDMDGIAMAVGFIVGVGINRFVRG